MRPMRPCMVQACRHAWCSVQPTTGGNAQWRVLDIAVAQTGDCIALRRHPQRQQTEPQTPQETAHHCSARVGTMPGGISHRARTECGTRGERGENIAVDSYNGCSRRLSVAHRMHSVGLLALGTVIAAQTVPWHRRSHRHCLQTNVTNQTVRTSAAHRRRGCSGVSRLCWSCSAGRTAAPDSRQR